MVLPAPRRGSKNSYATCSFIGSFMREVWSFIYLAVKPF